MTNPKMTEELNDIQRRMQGALEVLKKEFSGLRTGRASINLLDPVVVEAYGAKMPLTQVGNINTPEARMITVQVWDQSLVKVVEKAIRDAGLGLNPMAEGQLIRIPLPELTQERRQELIKVAAKYAEQARISIRNVRRDGMDVLKALEKDSSISEDEGRHFSDEIQKITDDFVKKVDELLAQKEKDISHV